jgi:hypothetical protein
MGEVHKYLLSFILLSLVALEICALAKLSYPAGLSASFAIGSNIF